MAWLPKSRKARQRLTILAIVAPLLIGAVALSLYAARDAVVFFYAPSEAQAQHVRPGQVVRIGGLVEPGSLSRAPDGTVRFRVTDNAAATAVAYKGVLPDLFREGQGVVAQGEFGADGMFRASQILAKHDERYMPREVAESLKKRGEWRPEGGPGA